MAASEVAAARKATGCDARPVLKRAISWRARRRGGRLANTRGFVRLVRGAALGRGPSGVSSYLSRIRLDETHSSQTGSKLS